MAFASNKGGQLLTSDGLKDNAEMTCTFATEDGGRLEFVIRHGCSVGEQGLSDMSVARIA